MHFGRLEGISLSFHEVHQDNLSSKLLKTNRRASSSKRTRHINIRYFFVANVIKRKHLKLKYCPTDKMIGDFFTKPVGGAKFRRFCNIIMNISHDEYGPVDVDELMALHNAKIQKRFKMIEHLKNGSESESTTSKENKMSADMNSQECVGDMRSRYMRSNVMWGAVRGAHNKRNNSVQARTRTYTQVVAE